MNRPYNPGHRGEHRDYHRNSIGGGMNSSSMGGGYAPNNGSGGHPHHQPHNIHRLNNKSASNASMMSSSGGANAVATGGGAGGITSSSNISGGGREYLHPRESSLGRGSGGSGVGNGGNGGPGISSSHASNNNPSSGPGIGGGGGGGAPSSMNTMSSQYKNNQEVGPRFKRNITPQQDTVENLQMRPSANSLIFKATTQHQKSNSIVLPISVPPSNGSGPTATGMTGAGAAQAARGGGGGGGQSTQSQQQQLNNAGQSFGSRGGPSSGVENMTAGGKTNAGGFGLKQQSAMATTEGDDGKTARMAAGGGAGNTVVTVGGGVGSNQSGSMSSMTENGGVASKQQQQQAAPQQPKKEKAVSKEEILKRAAVFIKEKFFYVQETVEVEKAKKSDKTTATVAKGTEAEKQNEKKNELNDDKDSLIPEEKVKEEKKDLDAAVVVKDKNDDGEEEQKEEASAVLSKNDYEGDSKTNKNDDDIKVEAKSEGEVPIQDKDSDENVTEKEPEEQVAEQKQESVVVTEKASENSNEVTAAAVEVKTDSNAPVTKEVGNDLREDGAVDCGEEGGKPVDLQLDDFIEGFLELKIPDKRMKDVCINLTLDVLERADEQYIDRLLSFYQSLRKRGTNIKQSVFLDIFKQTVNRMNEREVLNPRITTHVAYLLSKMCSIEITEESAQTAPVSGKKVDTKNKKNVESGGSNSNGNLLKLSDIGNYTENGQHYPLLLLVLQQLHRNLGRSQLEKLFNGSNIDLMNCLPEADRNKKRLGEILDDRALSFLCPLLKIEAEIGRQLNAEQTPNPSALYEWIKTNVNQKHWQDEGFIHSLMTAIIRHVTRLSTYPEGADASITPDKASTQKELLLFKIYCKILKPFLDNMPNTQLMAIYALQVFSHNEKFPKGK